MENGEVDPPSDRKGDWMLTITGRAYWPLDPRQEDVDIEDIAHALSMICRYTGHVVRFYSVAEHSLYVSYMVPEHLALEGLLHDAAEAYITDLNRPVKVHCPDYKIIERLNDVTIRARFNLPLEESPEVKQADMDLLISEKSQVCPESNDSYRWRWGGVDRGIRMYALTPDQAKYNFLRRFRQLYKEVRPL